MPDRARPDGGFTLLEMLVVVAVLGLVLAVAATRGPRTNVALDLRGTAGAVSDALRLARSRSVAANRPVTVLFDLPSHTVRLDDGLPLFLPAAVAVAVTSTADNVAAGRAGPVAAIRFSPDGSSSGGRVVLAEGGRRAQVGVDWLTGQVSVGP